jgi:hypothetical protein
MRSTNTFRALFPTVALLAGLASAYTYAQEALIRDSTGCGVFNSSPNAAPDVAVTITWTGACKNGLAQGSGVVEWFSNGKLVVHSEGFFRDGKRQGHSVSTYFSGGAVRLDGEFADNNIVHGVMTYTNGARYEGDFKDWKMSGQGKLIYADGNFYEGAFRAGKPDGQGTLVHTNGIREVGTFSNGAADRVNVYNETGVLIGSPDGDPVAEALERKNHPSPSQDAPQGPDPQVCAQFLEGIRNNCPNAARGGPQTIYCGTSRSMYISSGCDQSALVDDSNSGTVTVNIQNGGQRSPANTTPLSPRVTSQAAGAASPVYDKGLDQCVKIGDDGQSVYFENGCNASLTIAFYQPAGAGLGMTDCGPASRCTFGIAGIGFSGRNNTMIAVCPKGDYVEASPGVQWGGSGAFRCRRPL